MPSAAYLHSSSSLMSDFQTVANVGDIAPNSALTVDLNGVSVLVCLSEGRFLAVENRCSHQDQPLAEGRIRNGYIFCPLHGMRFKLESGEAIGQLTRKPIRVFETRVEGEAVQIREASAD